MLRLYDQLNYTSFIFLTQINHDWQHTVQFYKGIGNWKLLEFERESDRACDQVILVCALRQCIWRQSLLLQFQLWLMLYVDISWDNRLCACT